MGGGGVSRRSPRPPWALQLQGHLEKRRNPGKTTPFTELSVFFPVTGLLGSKEKTTGAGGPSTAGSPTAPVTSSVSPAPSKSAEAAHFYP